MDEENNLKIIYISYIGTDVDGLNVYHFLLSDEPDKVYSEDWGEIPAGNIRNDLLIPDNSQYQYIKELKTDLNLVLAQDNNCFSMQDCRDHVVCLAYEDINGYEEYPEPYRIVIQFGDYIDDIEDMLNERGYDLKFVD